MEPCWVLDQYPFGHPFPQAGFGTDICYSLASLECSPPPLVRRISEVIDISLRVVHFQNMLPLSLRTWTALLRSRTRYVCRVVCTGRRVSHACRSQALLWIGSLFEERRQWSIWYVFLTLHKHARCAWHRQYNTHPGILLQKYPRNDPKLHCHSRVAIPLVPGPDHNNTVFALLTRKIFDIELTRNILFLGSSAFNFTQCRSSSWFDSTSSQICLWRPWK